MDIKEMVQLIKEAHERTGIQITFEYSTVADVFQCWIFADKTDVKTIKEVDELKDLMDSLPSKKSHIESLIEKRDAIQRQIDAVGGQDLINN